MKKVYLITYFLIVTIVTYGQWTGSTELYNNIWRYGNVGIGTNSPNASISGTLLEINADGDVFPIFRLDRENGIEKQNSSYDFFITSSGDLGVRNNGAGYPILMKN